MEQKLSKLLRSSKTFLLSGRFFLSHPLSLSAALSLLPLPPPLSLSLAFSGVSSPAFISLSRLAIRLREREKYTDIVEHSRMECAWDIFLTITFAPPLPPPTVFFSTPRQVPPYIF